MTSGKETMGEQPIFTCKAHVFHIDPKTKRSWMPASSTAVNVSFFYDSSRSLYRIISVEGSKAVINSTVTPNMSFTKTSQKFGQWSDIRANTVYGLGFSSESELGKFIDKFQEVKEATRTAVNKMASNGNTSGTAPITPVTSANASPITSRAALPPPEQQQQQDLLEPPPSGTLQNAGKMDDEDWSSSSNVPHLRSHSVSNESPSHQIKMEKNPYGSIGVSTTTTTTTTTSSSSQNATPIDVQLKYENDRLKLALAQSSANAKKWEIELATLKNNNARLTSALQESTANVDEWKRQLHCYKEENMRMKVKYQSDLENSKGGGDLADELRKEIQALRHRVEQLEMELEAKNEEIKTLTHAHKLSDVHQTLQKENAELQSTAKLAQTELDVALSTHESQRQILMTLNEQLSSHVQELATIHHEIATALQT